jgi:hypothetical protein
VIGGLHARARSPKSATEASVCIMRLHNIVMPDKSTMTTTILLLSSEPVVRLVMQEVLERAGYVVMATGDLGVAVQRMGEATPDLLVISPYVESISGYDAAKYLHSRRTEMRVGESGTFPQAVHGRRAPGKGKGRFDCLEHLRFAQQPAQSSLLETRISLGEPIW